MKRFIYSSLLFLMSAFLVISCGSGNKNTGEQDHVHGEETHTHGDETHTHGNEGVIPFGQEDFVTGDSIQVDSLKQDSIDHSHDHDHDHDHPHQH